MRGILSWAAAAAILAIPASGWCQQSDPQGGQQAGQSNAAPAAPATTQAPAPQQESIAEAARKAREAKKEAPKATKVFTNDDIPGAGGLSTVGEAKDGKEGDAGAADKDASANGEKAWREKFATLRAKLAHDQEDLSVMQREIGVLDVQNYSDPVKAMQQELTRDDINKKAADIDAKTQQIKADQQAIDDAEDDLRKSGGDSGWSR
jgi:chromosome segregation ATPase